ncbi:MAG: glycosyltransferase family 4 protein [Planctomycetes bacterium]|nr:glycosyltransferase family 4 protein [Planctomycetota bacterium]
MRSPAPPRPRGGTARIALDYRPALLGSSGIPRAVRELARALAVHADAAAVELHLFGHSLAAARRATTPPLGARLHRLPIPGRLLPRLARLGLGAERLAGGAAVFHWTDYVHPPVGARTRVALTLHDCAFLAADSYHGPVGSAELARRTRAAVARADVVVCPTRATRDDAQRLLDVPAGRLRVIPFGADHALPSAQLDAVPAEPFLLSIGTIEPRKNHLGLLRAWRALGADRPWLVVVGRPGWACADAVATLRAAQADGGVTWHRHLDDAQLAGLLDRALGVVYPSLLEGFGFPPLEALARGVPVLAGDTPALRETVGGAARLVDPRDDDALRAGLVELLAEAARADPAAAAARVRCAARFRWDTCARAHLALYREVLDA